MSVDIKLATYICYGLAGSLVVLSFLVNIILSLPKKDKGKVNKSQSGDAVSKLTVGEVTHFSQKKDMKYATPSAD